MTAELEFWWTFSLAAEVGVAAVLGARPSWRRMYPRFALYISLDLIASAAMLLIHKLAGVSGFDLPWRVTQTTLCLVRMAMVSEAYEQIQRLRASWHFPLRFFLLVSVLCSCGVTLFMVDSPRWYGSFLEPTWALIAASNTFFGFLILAVLVAARCDRLGSTQQVRHATILCVYLLLTGACYFSAAKFPDRIGLALMIIAAICYSSWLILFSRRQAAE